MLPINCCVLSLLALNCREKKTGREWMRREKRGKRRGREGGEERRKKSGREKGVQKHCNLKGLEKDDLKSF